MVEKSRGLWYNVDVETSELKSRENIALKSLLDYNCLSVDNIKKSIKLMDKFVEPENQYDFLVLRHWLHTITEDYWSGYYIDLCIQKTSAKRKKICGYLTMTELREEQHKGIMDWSVFEDEYSEPDSLFQSIAYTLSKTELSNIKNDQMIPLDYCVHLGAQTSENRTGYGWEWDWSFGYGDYVEGTFYGEVTDFYITHIVVSKIERPKTIEEQKQEELTRLYDIIETMESDEENIKNSMSLEGGILVHKLWGECVMFDYASTKFTIRLKYQDKQSSAISLLYAFSNKLIEFKDKHVVELMAALLKIEGKKEVITKKIKTLERAKEWNDIFTALYMMNNQ